MITPALANWRRYAPEVKTELFSTAFCDGEGRWWFVDPFMDAEEAMAGRTTAGVILTNGNHERNCAAYLAAGIPVFAHPEAFPGKTLRASSALPGPIRTISLPGAGAGEIAVLFGQTCILGDALIHLPPKYPLGFLPDRYCTDARRLRESVRALLAEPIEILCFAHGEPLRGGVSRRLAALYR